ncbi:unnamed protein product [Staurois parvus]|uniref:Uncharacterized protein n=1 Tax=Staurois parvus TaxID=386267 RepID=A0ABN9AIC8_9NEOB|nr:unnamed protein product [Staurois parvus]
MSARSCDQLCPITADHMRDMYTDHQGTDDQCALMISVAPAVLPVSAHQCQLSVIINATCQCPSAARQCHISVPTSAHQCHISAHLSCLSVSPISAPYQCPLSVRISAAYQHHICVLPFSAYQ